MKLRPVNLYYIPLIGSLATCCPNFLQAQTPAATAKATPVAAVTPSSAKSPVININLDLNTTSDYLPFDVDFRLAGGASGDKITVDDISAADLFYTEQAGQAPYPTLDTASKKKWKYITWRNTHTSNQYYFKIPALKPNSYFSFYIHYKRVLTADEKTKLTSYAQTVLQPALIIKANKKDFEFSDPEIREIVTGAETQISTFVLRDGLSVAWSTLDADHYRALFKTVAVLADGFESARLDRENLDANIQAYKNTDGLLRLVRNAYVRANPHPNDKVRKNIAAIDTLHRMIFNTFNYPVDPINADPAVIKAYSDNCGAVMNQLKKVDQAQIPGFAPLSLSIYDFSDGLQQQFITWLNDLKSAQALVGPQLNSFIDAVSVSLYNDASIEGSTINGDFVTRANWYISADLGVAVLPGINKISPYVGTDIYFRPINTNRPLQWKDGDNFAKRFSLVLGVSIASFAKTNYRADLLGSNFNLLTGAGFRFTDWIRVSSGLAWYSKVNPDPLNTNTTVKPTVFISLAFDLRIKTALNALFNNVTLPQ